jgi:hypothetical protein
MALSKNIDKLNTNVSNMNATLDENHDKLILLMDLSLYPTATNVN